MAVTSRIYIRVSFRGTPQAQGRRHALFTRSCLHLRSAVIMGRQSCAIGACPEKSYRKSEGVKFFNLKWIKDETIKRAWKKKILATREDIKSEACLNDVAICSRHFVDGDKRNLPTIIPRFIDGEIIWPDSKATNRKLPLRRTLWSTTPPDETTASCSGSSTDTQTCTTTPLSAKLTKICTQLSSSPPKEVKEIYKRKDDEINCLSPLAHSLYMEMTTPQEKEMPVAKKLKILQEKCLNEPAGVNSRTCISDLTPRVPVKDEIIVNLKKALDREREKNRELTIALEQARNVQIFGVDRFKESPFDFSFYTGVPDYLTFLELLDMLQPEKNNITCIYYQTKPCDETYVNSRGRGETLGLHDQLFLVLSRLRQGYKEIDLAHRFAISQTTVSRIFSKWIKHMATVLEELPLWAPKDLIRSKMPQAFTDLEFDNTRCIVDCTEIFIEQSSSNLALQSVLFSTYKNHHTAKGLVAIAPHGPITFVSDLYAGSSSDFDITKGCGLLQLLEPHDHVMADKGFEIQKLLDEYKVRVDHPPILRGVSQMSLEDETKTRRIARLRIHVERAIERIKNFAILQETFSHRQCRLLNDVWKCCTRLTHLQPPILDDD